MATNLSPSEALQLDLLNQARAELEPEFATLAKPTECYGLLFHALKAEGTAASKLANALADDPSLRPLLRGWVQVTGGGHLLQSHTLPIALLRRHLTSGDGLDLLHRFKEFATHGTSGLTANFAVIGACTAAPMVIAPAVQLRPWSDVAPEWRRKFERDILDIELEGVRASPNQPSAVIQIELPARQIVFGSYEEATSEEPDPFRELDFANLVAGDIIRCLGLLTSVPIGYAGSWFSVSNEAASTIAHSASSSSSDLQDFTLLKAGMDPADVGGVDLASVFTSLRRHRTQDQDLLRLAIDRLGMSLRRWSLVDKAIDLGIAMEAIILNDLEVQGELRYRLAVRGATFLGGTASTRTARFNTLRTAYDLRSMAVHTGSIRRFKKGEAAARNVLDQATAIVSRILSAVILARQLPAWEEHVIGGTGASLTS